MMSMEGHIGRQWFEHARKDKIVGWNDINGKRRY